MQQFSLYIMYFKFDVIHVKSPHHRLLFRSPHPHQHFSHNRVGKRHSALMLLLNYTPTLNTFYLMLVKCLLRRGPSKHDQHQQEAQGPLRSA